MVFEVVVNVARDVEVVHKSVEKFCHGDAAVPPFSADERHVETSANALRARIDCGGGRWVDVACCMLEALASRASMRRLITSANPGWAAMRC